MAAVRARRDVVLHAAAGVEQQAQPQVHRLGVGVAAQEVGHVLRGAVFEQREVVGLEVADEVALPVHHHHGDVDQVDLRPEPALLAQDASGCRRNDRRAQDDRPHAHSLGEETVRSADDSTPAPCPHRFCPRLLPRRVGLLEGPPARLRTRTIRFSPSGAGQRRVEVHVVDPVHRARHGRRERVEVVDVAVSRVEQVEDIQRQARRARQAVARLEIHQARCRRADRAVLDQRPRTEVPPAHAPEHRVGGCRPSRPPTSRSRRRRESRRRRGRRR